MALKLTPAAVAAILLIASLINVIVAAAHANLAALDDAVFLSIPNSVYNPGFGPRLFARGIPAIPAQLSEKRKRQDEAAQCPSGNHSCLDLGPIGSTYCCSNDQYCFLNTTWVPNCCSIGNDCTQEDSLCPEDAVYCNSTVTSTTTIATSATVTAIVQTSLSPGCCQRPCTSSSFLCQAGFGGQCCGNVARCLSNGGCFTPSTPSPPTIVTPVPSGCSTSQFSCATGGGCCDFGSICTSSTVAATVSQFCIPNLTVVDTGGGLSDGARVGIGVGIAVGAAIVIGGLTWFCLHRRRVAKSRRQGEILIGPGRENQEEIDEDYVRPFVPHSIANSDITSPNGMSMRPRLHDTGLVFTYNGSDAVAGPYTDRGDSTTAQGTESRSSPGFSERVATTANFYPENPDDIVQPVELYAPKHMPTELGGTESSVGGKELVSNSTPAKQGDQGPFELFELDGSPRRAPQSTDTEKAGNHETQGISPSPQATPKLDQQDNDGHK